MVLQNSAFDTEHLKDNIGARALHGGVATVVGQAGRFALSVITTAFLARLLLPADFGLVAMVTVITGFVTMFRDLGLSTAAVQSTKLDHAQASGLFWVNSGFALCLGLLTVTLAPVVSSFYLESRLTPITWVLAITIPLGGLAAQHLALLRRQMRFKALVVADFLSLFLGGVVAICVALLGGGYWSLVVRILTESAATLACAWWASGWLPGTPRRNVGLRKLLVFGGNVTGSNLLNFVASRADVFLLGRYFGSGVVGVYERAQQLLLFPLQQLNAPLGAVSVPALSRIADESDRYQRAYFAIVEKLLLLSVPSMVYLVVSADWLVLLVLGPNWGETTEIFRVFGIAGVLLPFLSTTGWLFVTQARTSELLRWSVADASIKLSALFVGLPWGPLGVATAQLFRITVATPILVYLIGRKGPVSSRALVSMLWPLLLSAVPAFIATILLRLAFPRLSLGGGLVLMLFPAFGVYWSALAALPRGRRVLGSAWLTARRLVPN